MVVPRMSKILCSLLALSTLTFTTNTFAAINTQAMNAEPNNAQMVNLNLQIKTNNKLEKSNLTMPFYQTAELERKINDKNVLIEINPRRGKTADEIALELKFYKASGSKAFYKKEFIAKVNEESHISFRGMTMKVKPVLN
jgi:hypothetical protein